MSKLFICPKAKAGKCPDKDCNCYEPHSHDDVDDDSICCQWPDFDGEWRDQKFKCVRVRGDGK